jgi:hypothetical protein
MKVTDIATEIRMWASQLAAGDWKCLDETMRGFADELDEGCTYKGALVECCAMDCPVHFPPDPVESMEYEDDCSEGLILAGMAHGNRGLADYGGLHDGPGECGHHCNDDCPRCGEPQ